MNNSFNSYIIYDLSDKDIIKELCKKIKQTRLSCCFSQKEMAEKCGLSIITIKRIESGIVEDITLGTLLKIMRISGTLENIVDLVPDLPESPYLINPKTGKKIQRINSKRKSL